MKAISLALMFGFAPNPRRWRSFEQSVLTLSGRRPAPSPGLAPKPAAAVPGQDRVQGGVPGRRRGAHFLGSDSPACSNNREPQTSPPLCPTMRKCEGEKRLIPGLPAQKGNLLPCWSQRSTERNLIARGPAQVGSWPAPSLDVPEIRGFR